MNGEQLGPYTLKSHLGSGGMGEVYLAHDPRLDRDVALKVLKEEMLADEDRRARFQREAKAAAGLNHPSITTIHEVGVADGQDFIAQELVEGKTLTALLEERQLSLIEVAEFAVPLADALAYAHEQRVIHRDIKPGNVMLTERGLPKLLDFGLAKVMQDPNDKSGLNHPTHTLTVEGAIFGTPSAMSPEQALGREVDNRSDVFSFGSLLYEMVTGRPAFIGETVIETMDKVLHAEPEPLAKVRRDLPTGFITIVEKALRKDPGERYQSMSEMSADLRHFKRQTDSGLVPPVITPSRDGAKPRLKLALGALLVVALGLVAWQLDWLGGSGEGAPVGAEGGYTAVMYVANLDDPADANRHGSMLARLLTTGLNSGDRLEMLSQQRLYDVATESGIEDGRIDRSTASKVARNAGVSTMIIGEIGSLGTQFVATTELVDVASGRSLGQAQAQGASPEEMFALAEDLSAELRDLLGASIGRAEAQALERQLTPSVDAYRAYVRAEELMERNIFRGARDAFKEATELDPGFALAWFWQGIVMGWTTGNPDQAQGDCFRRAIVFRDRLPQDIARVADAALIQVESGWSNSVPLLEQIVREDPSLLPAHYLIAEAFLHSPLVNDVDRAVEHFERVLALDPGFSLIYEHLTSATLIAGDYAKARARLSGWKKTQPEIVAALNAWSDYLEGNHEGLEAQSDTNIGRQLGFSGLARIFNDDWEGWDDGVDWERLDEIAKARDYDALMEEARMSERWPFNSLAYWRTSFEMLIGIGMINWSPDSGFSQSEREEFARQDVGLFSLGTNRHRFARIHKLMGKDEDARKITEGVFIRYPRAPRALYIAAKFAARDGDLARARELLITLESLLPGLGPNAPRYSNAIAAEVALAEGDAAEARRLYEAVIAEGRVGADAYAHGSSAGPLWREGLARACAAEGDLEAASRAWRALIDSGHERSTTPILWISGLYELGVLELELGRTEGGRAQLERFLLFWGDVNPDLPMVVDARRLLGQ